MDGGGKDEPKFHPIIGSSLSGLRDFGTIIDHWSAPSMELVLFQNGGTNPIHHVQLSSHVLWAEMSRKAAKATSYQCALAKHLPIGRIHNFGYKMRSLARVGTAI